MSKIEFKTLEEAVSAFEAKSAENDSLKKDLELSKERESSLEKDLLEARSVAEDAIEKFNSKPSSNDIVVTVQKKKYKVLFGVDGLSKEELSNDSSKIVELLKLGSQALELIEG